MFSNDNYFVVMYKYDLPAGFVGADYGLHVVVDKYSGDVVYIGGLGAVVFDEHFPREVDFGPYYEGVFVSR